MAIIDTEGIVTKETKYGDTSRILTVITKDLGRISVLAGNVRRKKSGMLSAASLFSYSRFTLFKGRSSLYKLNDCKLVHSFSSLHESLDKMAYAAYFCDVTNSIVQEESSDIRQAELLIRSLYLLSNVQDNLSANPGSISISKNISANIQAEKIKAVFEFRTLSINGLMPNLKTCAGCGGVQNLNFLSPKEGCIYCSACGKAAKAVTEINDSILAAISYIALAPDKKEFSFTLSPPSIEYLSRVGETCIEILLEKTFKTLDYLRKVTALG